MGQLSFLSIAQAKKELRRDKFLNQMSKVIPWSRLKEMISPYYGNKVIGRKRIPLDRMLRIHCLQHWYGLSDPAMEEEIYDRSSFQKFLDIDILHDPVPDETTILNFRHLLERHELQRSIFEEINTFLTERGFLMNKGTIVDATLISAPKSTKNKERKRDPEMSSTKKGNQWYFGMKAHVGVDCQSGLVHSIKATTAKRNDSKMLDEILHGDESAILGDKGYFNEKRKQKARKDGVFWGILDKKKKGKGLSSSQQKRNNRLASPRAKVEHPFQVIKCQWGYRKTRYRGINKNEGQLHLLFGLFNLFKVRKKILSSAFAG